MRKFLTESLYSHEQSADRNMNVKSVFDEDSEGHGGAHYFKLEEKWSYTAGRELDLIVFSSSRQNKT